MEAKTFFTRKVRRWVIIGLLKVMQSAIASIVLSGMVFDFGCTNAEHHVAC